MFIEHRDEKRRQTEGDRLEHELWMETVTAYNERERRQIRAEWYGWHCVTRQRATGAPLRPSYVATRQRRRGF